MTWTPLSRSKGQRHGGGGILWQSPAQLVLKILTRRLATALLQSDHASAFVTKNFGQGKGMIEPLKIFLSSGLITVQYLVAKCHTMRATFRCKKIGGAGAPLPWESDCA